MKKALISVTDKKALLELIDCLTDNSFEIISTGGTLKHILENGRQATPIDNYTGFPEILDGRVKTLHPKVHGGILHKRDNISHIEQIHAHGIDGIDVVVVNLYDFEGTLKSGKSHEEIVENIDIGGPSMIRSAAKNFKDVLVVVDPRDYGEVAEKIRTNSVDEIFRERMAMKAFALTAYYDSLIANYFIKRQCISDGFINVDQSLDTFTMPLKKSQNLRYGENPHQNAVAYDIVTENSLLSAFEQLGGKEISYNNLYDLNTAVEICKDFYDANLIATAAIKHANPCAVALGKDTVDSYQKAFDADSLSIFGGVIATTGTVDLAAALEINKTFIEIIAANDFTEDGLEELRKKTNLRIVKVNYSNRPSSEVVKSINGKVLVQTADYQADENWEVVTKNEPNDDEMGDLEFAMVVAKHSKSNAVVIAKNKVTLGIGSGQTSRVWALDAAINNNKGKDFTGAVLASDAFFPFPDCVEIASGVGISTIVQPGGAKRDQESIDCCNKNGIAMIFTGTRHFKH